VRQQRLAVQHTKSARTAKVSPLAKIGIYDGEGLNTMGDLEVKAPGGGIPVGQMFRARGAKDTQKLAMTYPGASPQLPGSYYAPGIGAPINTNPNLPAVSFVAAPSGGSASVTMPIYTRTPQNPWVSPPPKMSAVERARISAATAEQAAITAQAASEGIASAHAADVGGEGGADATAATEVAVGGPGSEAGEAGAKEGAAAAAEGDASTTAASKDVGGLAKAGLALTRASSAALALREHAGGMPRAMTSIIAKPILAGGGGESAQAAMTPQLKTAQTRWRTEEMKVAGFMAEQEASRMTDRPPQPVIGAGADTFILSIPRVDANTQLQSQVQHMVGSGAPHLKAVGTQRLGAVGATAGDNSLEEKGAQGL